jgi:hypothetical protein
MSYDLGCGRPRLTHCYRGHEFTAENTYVNPGGERSCRICNKARRVNSMKPGLLTCPECGVERLVQRTNRPDRVYDGLCQKCSTRKTNDLRALPQRVESTEDLRRWWIETVPLSEIRDLVREIHPDALADAQARKRRIGHAAWLRETNDFLTGLDIEELAA